MSVNDKGAPTKPNGFFGATTPQPKGLFFSENTPNAPTEAPTQNGSQNTKRKPKMEAKMEAKMKDKPKKEAPTLCGSPNGKSCVGALGWSTPTQQKNPCFAPTPQRKFTTLPLPQPNPS